MALNKIENILVCFTNWNSIYKIDLNHQVLFTNNMLIFETKQKFHHTQIIGYDVCLQKPFVLTCAKENSIKVWNYETGQLELNKKFVENIKSASISPNGLYVIISFYSKLILYSILVEDLKCLKTFALSNFLFLFQILKENYKLNYPSQETVLASHLGKT